MSHVLGSKPTKDPLEEVKGARYAVQESVDIKWVDRSVSRPWEVVALCSLASLVTSMVAPYWVIGGSGVLFLFLVYFYYFRPIRMLERTGLMRVKERNLDLSRPGTGNGSLGYLRKTSSNPSVYLTGLRLDAPGAILSGDMSRLVRGVPTSAALFVSVRMAPAKLRAIVNDNTISGAHEAYLDHLEHDALYGYFQKRGGLWQSSVQVILQSSELSTLARCRNSVKGAIPSRNWKDLTWVQKKRLEVRRLALSSDAFYALGIELSEWLVQMRTELAAEVGESVPGQFVAPIREQPDQYYLGRILNPDTLELGPRTGPTYDNIRTGTIICGSDYALRRRIEALTIQALLGDGKRIILVSTNPLADELVALSDSGVILRLGSDLILNPVDSDGIDRTTYLPRLITALEIVAGKDLSNAPMFEGALSRAVALNDTTIADVRIQSDDPMGGDPSVSSREDREQNDASRAGMAAIQTLLEGSAARAFYGHQTVPMSALGEHELTIVKVGLGSEPLDIFALDLLALKLLTLEDENLVVFFDDAENFLVDNMKYRKRSLFAQRLVRELLQRFGVVLSVEHPNEIPARITNSIETVIAGRTKGGDNVAVVSELLGLKVIETGMHSKARWSARESSFLRVMDDDTVLIVNGSETCRPMRLFEEPDLIVEDLRSLRERSRSLTKSRGSHTFHSKRLVDQIEDDAGINMRVLELLDQYEPLTEEAISKFISAQDEENVDVKAVLMRLEEANMILPGHEQHAGVSYKNFRLTMKGRMALKQSEPQGGDVS